MLTIYFLLVLGFAIPHLWFKSRCWRIVSSNCAHTGLRSAITAAPNQSRRAALLHGASGKQLCPNPCLSELDCTSSSFDSTYQWGGSQRGRHNTHSDCVDMAELSRWCVHRP